MTAIPAGVFGFLCAFIEFVEASVASVRMARAGGADELSYVCEAVSAIFAIVVCHRLKVFSDTKKGAASISSVPITQASPNASNKKNKKILLPRLSEYEDAPIGARHTYTLTGKSISCLDLCSRCFGDFE